MMGPLVLRYDGQMARGTGKSDAMFKIHGILECIIGLIFWKVRPAAVSMYYWLGTCIDAGGHWICSFALYEGWAIVKGSCSPASTQLCNLDRAKAIFAHVLAMGLAFHIILTPTHFSYISDTRLWLTPGWPS